MGRDIRRARTRSSQIGYRYPSSALTVRFAGLATCADGNTAFTSIAAALGRAYFRSNCKRTARVVTESS